MADNIATIVDWYGPYKDVAAARSAARSDYAAGLYVAIGHGEQKRRGPVEMLYVGISDNLVDRIGPAHATLSKLSISGLWLGEIATAGIPGRRQKRTDPHLDIVEWMTAYFLHVPFNARKVINPPNLSAVVLNRWWKIDYETACDRPVRRWADVIEWNTTSEIANLCWFGTKPRVVRLNKDGKIVPIRAR